MNKKSSCFVITKMLKYANDSIKYLSGMSYDDFINDEKTLIFSVFSLSQLGELVVHIDQSIRENNPDIQWKAIKGLRDRIVYDYDGVQYKILWNVLSSDIPKIIIKLDNILKYLENEQIN